MGDSNELLTLAQVSSEIGESEIKVTFANQCIKAQEALANKLKEEIQRRKDICNEKKNENLKLEAEIRNAELEIENLRITGITVRNAKMEIKKELLLTKERKNKLTERIRENEEKYEALWIKSKARYENIPIVKKLLETNTSNEALKNNIEMLTREAQNLEEAIVVKKNILAESDRKMLVQLANFIVNERPKALKVIEEKYQLLNQMVKELEQISKGHTIQLNENANSIIPKLNKSSDGMKSMNKWTLNDALMIPKLQLPSSDMGLVNLRLDISKVTLHSSPVKRSVSIVELEKNTMKRTKVDEQLKDNYISCYFNKTAKDMKLSKDNADDNIVNYSNKKLINILEDIHIDERETYKLVANTNIDDFQEVNVIKSNNFAKEKSPPSKAPLESDEIEEIDMTNTNTEVLIPPTQFLDITQDIYEESVQVADVIVHVDAGKSPVDFRSSQTKSSQESRKKVSFELPVVEEEPEELNKSADKTNPNDTITSQLDLSAVTDDNYMSIKDMILKKHKLDLSPQFVYAKNTGLQKKNDEKTVTSKFFEISNEKTVKMSDDSKLNENNDNLNTMKGCDQNNEAGSKVVEQGTELNNIVSMDVDNAVSSPKSHEADKPIAGLLFTHGPNGITDFDISMSTTGYEEGDSDFPHCLDNSILLSPKADLPLPMSGNDNEAVSSQDMPSFLSGFRKTGISFFKQMPSSAAENKQTPENNFNFQFGGEDKKNRGGLFSFFR